MADLAETLSRDHQLPVLDGVSCAVGLAESMVRLRIFTSRLGGYSPPFRVAAVKPELISTQD
jgi:allantoin racemase